MWKILVINRHGQRKQCIKGLLQTMLKHTNVLQAGEGFLFYLFKIPLVLKIKL